MKPLAFRSVLACLMAIASSCYQTADAAKYIITFVEGEHRYNPNDKPSTLSNKYLAKVTVEVDSVVKATVRGSTLPDSHFFYVGWHADGRIFSPTDADIERVEPNIQFTSDRLRSSARAYPDYSLGIERNLADINDIMRFLSRVPVLWSGTYAFAMGLHQKYRCYEENGSPKMSGGKRVCAHGYPRVPRLLGGGSQQPFNPRSTQFNLSATTRPLEVSSGKLYQGGWIATINRNNSEGQGRVANGINIHDGRKNDDYRDSEGCLTIAPGKDWETFYDALPSPEQWYAQGHSGFVIIDRSKQRTGTDKPLPPSRLRGL